MGYKNVFTFLVTRISQLVKRQYDLFENMFSFLNCLLIITVRLGFGSLNEIHCKTLITNVMRAF